MKTCSRCRVEKPLDAFYPDTSKRLGVSSFCRACQIERSRKRYWENPERARMYNQAYYQQNRDKYLNQARILRQKVLEAYGDECKCCGERTPEFLSIDHVNGGGKAHRLQLKGYGRSMYRWLKMEGFPQDGRFQLLCHNCNMAKGAYGKCPHQSR